MKYLLPIIIGAIIGYFTNWLAIKMLFRPHTQKKIFNIPIPFTPGLIPKEKTRMAETIGQTVGTHLLSSETITNALYSEKVSNQIEGWIADRLDELKKSNKTIKEVIFSLIGAHLNELTETIKVKLAGLVCNQLKEAKFKRKLIEIINVEIFDKFDETSIKMLKIKIQEYIYDFSTTPEVKKSLKNIIDIKLKDFENDNRQINEVLPSEFSDTVRMYLDEHNEKVAEFIKEIVKSETIEERLKLGITEIVKQNVSSVITMFISPESITEKVFDSIQEYIVLEENKTSIITTIQTIIDKLLSTKISDIMNGLDEKDKEKGSEYLLEVVSGYLVNKNNQQIIFDIIEQRLKNSEKDIRKYLINFVTKKVDEITESPELVKYISKIINELIDKMLNNPISVIFKTLDTSFSCGITKLVMNMIEIFVKIKSPKLIEMLNISKLVEKQINSFDVAFAEKLIIEISNKELKAITWFGAVLGGLIGMLTPILQYLY